MAATFDDFLDDEEFWPIFEAAVNTYDVPIWMHPARGANMPDYASEKKSKFEIWWTFGWPYETSAAMTRMVFSGFFDTEIGGKRDGETGERDVLREMTGPRFQSFIGHDA